MPETHASSGWKTISRDACPHRAGLRQGVTSSKTACEACGLTEDLRVCLTCGHVACCESRGAHDTEHYKATGHPFIKPHGCDDDWLWCYACGAFLA